MAVTRTKTWIAGEVLTASDLNTEFNNVLSNGESLGFPATTSKDFDGQELILDSDADTSITADTDDRIDFKLGGVDLFRFDGTTASLVNGLDFVGSIATADVAILTMGSDTNIDLDLQTKGSGGVFINGVLVATTQFADNTGFDDDSGNEYIRFQKATTAVNYFDIFNAATATDLVIAAAGDDTNIDIDLQGKGTGRILANGSVVGGQAYKSYHFASFTGSSGTLFIAGYYDLAAADLNLTQASTTGTHGAVNVPYGAHALLVAAAAGAASGGATGTADITVSGTSVTDAGVRTGSDTEIIVADVTAMSTDEYFETGKKWIGQITYTIAATGDHTTFNADFNVGFAKYDDFGNQDFTVTEFEAVGDAGANDSGFDVTLCKHVADGWSYSAAAFGIPTGNAIASMNTVYSTEKDIDSGVDFAFKRTGLTTAITGSGEAATGVPNGVLIMIESTANGAVERMDCHVGVKFT